MVICTATRVGQTAITRHSVADYSRPRMEGNWECTAFPIFQHSGMEKQDGGVVVGHMSGPYLKGNRWTKEMIEKIRGGERGS